MRKFLFGVFITLIFTCGYVLDATVWADNLADEVVRLEIENETLSKENKLCYGEER